MKTKRRRLYFIISLLNVPLGLATRWAPQYFPEIVRIYGGDVLGTLLAMGFAYLLENISRMARLAA